MSILNAPKAVYKAQQAKKQMEKIQAAGISDGVSILTNGLNDVVDVEIDIDMYRDILGESFDEEKMKKLLMKLAEGFKKASADAKKHLERELMASTSLDDLKGLLGG